MSEGYDYTAGDPIPEEALDAADIVIGGSGATRHDAEKTQSENSFSDLEPGFYLLKIVGFGKADMKRFETNVNGHPVGYEAINLEVRFADVANPGGRIRNYFRLPPAGDADNFAYNEGVKGDGKPDNFMSKMFNHFVEQLFPGQAYKINQATGFKELTPLVKSLAAWKGRSVYAEVVEGKVNPNAKVNPATQEPYPPNNQVRLFSWRPFVEGQPSPYADAKATGKPAAKAVKAPAVNGAAVAAASGLDNI